VTFFGCHLPTDTRVLPFYIVFSRDEVNTRLAQPLDFHFVDEGNEGVLCGLDSLTGTSWLAFDKQSKRVAFLTNFRSPNNAVMKAEKSRGRLVMDWVKNNLTLEEFSQSIFSEIDGYRGFNLVFGTVALQPEDTSLYYISNYSEEIWQEKKPVKLEIGKLYGLANGLLEEWGKAKQGKTKIQAYLDSFSELAIDPDIEESKEENLSTFADRVITDIMESQDRQYVWNCPKTGIGSHKDWLFSSLFIQNNFSNFWTVSSSSIIITEEGKGVFLERTYNHSPKGYLSSVLYSSFKMNRLLGVGKAAYTKTDKVIEFTID